MSSSEPMRIRVRTNFAQNTKSITHEQTIELDSPVVPADMEGGVVVLAVDMGGEFEPWNSVYHKVLKQARDVAAEELEARRKRFLTQME